MGLWFIIRPYIIESHEDVLLGMVTHDVTHVARGPVWDYMDRAHEQNLFLASFINATAAKPSNMVVSLDVMAISLPVLPYTTYPIA